MKIFESIISNPFYIFLFGSGGFLVIAISIVSFFITHPKKENGINVVNSKKTSIKGNNIDNQSINVKNSEGTDIHNNLR